MKKKRFKTSCNNVSPRDIITKTQVKSVLKNNQYQ